jgi:hypothetical protein
VPQPTGSTAAIEIFSAGKEHPSLTGIPWFPGLTVLQAMVIGQAMYGETAFCFRLVYHSEYGAFVDMIDDVPQGGGDFWFLRVDAQDAAFGPAEQILAQPPQGAVCTISWSLEPAPANATGRFTASAGS